MGRWMCCGQSIGAVDGMLDESVVACGLMRRKMDYSIHRLMRRWLFGWAAMRPQCVGSVHRLIGW